MRGVTVLWKRDEVTVYMSFVLVRSHEVSEMRGTVVFGVFGFTFFCHDVASVGAARVGGRGHSPIEIHSRRWG